MKIYTSSWYSKLPADIKRIGVSRGTPRGQAAGFKLLRDLNPGPWFKTAGLAEYVPLYNDILRSLSAHAIMQTLASYSNGGDCALLCYEDPRKIDTGEDFCHRHLAAQWLEDTLGIKVEEYGHPDLNRFAALDREGISRPSYA